MATPPKPPEDVGDQIEEGKAIHVIFVELPAPVAPFGQVLKGARKLDS